MQEPPDSSHFLIILLSLFTSIPRVLRCSCVLFGPEVSSGQWLLVLRKCVRAWALFPWVHWCPFGPLLPKPKLLHSDLTTVGHFTELLIDSTYEEELCLLPHYLPTLPSYNWPPKSLEMSPETQVPSQAHLRHFPGCRRVLSFLLSLSWPRSFPRRIMPTLSPADALTNWKVPAQL